MWRELRTMNYELPTTSYANSLNAPHSQKFLVIPSITLFLCAFCAFLWLKNPRNQRNPRLINDLCVYKVLYNCRDTSTGIESALQIRLFMQNKANFRKVKLNVNKVLTKDYDKKDTWSSGTKQSQTKPNKAKFKKAKMNVSSIITKDYENKSPIWAPKKQSQFSKRQKPMQTSLSQRIMKKNTISGYDKTNPKRTQSNPMLARHQCGGTEPKKRGENMSRRKDDQAKRWGYQNILRRR